MFQGRSIITNLLLMTLFLFFFLSITKNVHNNTLIACDVTRRWPNADVTL